MKIINRNRLQNILYIAKKIAKFVFFVALAMLLPQLVLADSSPSAGFLNSSLFTPPSGDLSIALLKKIFGSVGSLSGTGTTIFGKMFYAFNSAVLVIIGCVLSYTTFRSVMEIAHGELGQSQMRKFNWWHVIRVVVGAGIAVPQATGYSIINAVVMWVVIQGVGLADVVWKQAVDYMFQGGGLYPTAAQGTGLGVTDQKINLNLINAKVGSTVGACDKDDKDCMTSGHVLSSLICMNYLYNVVEDSRVARLQEALSADKAKNYTDADRALLKIKIPKFHETYLNGGVRKDQWSAMFPGNANEVLPPPQQKGTVNLNGVCGIYKWGNVPKAAGTASDWKNYRDAKEAGLRQMVIGLNNVADNSVNLYKDKKSTVDFPQSFHETAYISLVNTVAAYQSITNLMRVYAGNGYKTADTYDPSMPPVKQDDLIKNGWINAGSFYFTLVRMKAKSMNLDKDISYNIATSSLPPICSVNDYDPSASCNPTYTDDRKPTGDDPGSLTYLFKAYLGQDKGKAYLDNLKDRLVWHTTDQDSMDNIRIKAWGLAYQLNRAAENTAFNLELPVALKNYIVGGQVDISVTSPGGENRRSEINEDLWNTKDGFWHFGDINPEKLYKDSSEDATDRHSAVMLFREAERIVFDPLNDSLSKVFLKWNEMFASTTQKNFPIESLMDLGKTMITEFFSYWSNMFVSLTQRLWGYMAGGVASYLVALAASLADIFGVSFVDAANGLGALLQFIVKITIEIPLFLMLPLAGAVTSILMINGVVLAYYIPMLPFMLFLFGVINWFSFVIEGMVAAPLIALGLTHPEGHDLMGQTQQALMLLVSILVRPTVMIFGLIAGMVLSYVALDVLNAGFRNIIDSLYYANGSSVAPVGGAIQVQNCAMILIYTLIVMAIVQQCFSLIAILPSAVMDWIGGPKRQSDEAHLAETVKSGLGDVAGKLGGTPGEMARGTQAGPEISHLHGKDKDKPASGTAVTKKKP